MTLLVLLAASNSQRYHVQRKAGEIIETNQIIINPSHSIRLPVRDKRYSGSSDR